LQPLQPPLQTLQTLPPNPPPPAPLSPAPRLSSTDYRNRQALLNKVHRFWIKGVLENSLHGQVLLTLGLEERADALALPWNMSWKNNPHTPQPAQPLDAGTSVFDVFQQLGEGRSLLILGEPGAGKTTTLLTLARDLLQQLESNHRIPAIFNLSSWTGEPIDQWLIAELNSKYQIPKAIGKSWVNDQQLLLLLDGLDEVRIDRRDRCAAAINQFHQDYGPELVVCCRIKDYEALSQQLGFQSALYVRSLSDQQIWQYLDQAETGLTGLRSLLERSAQQSQQSADVLAQPSALLAQPSLLDLARSPLILNIMALTYQGVSASQIPALTASQNQTQNYTHQLFSAYIARMFQRRSLTDSSSRPYSQQQTLSWLHALAVNMTTTSQTVFLIERMQPDWLTSRRQRWVFGALIWVTFILSATVVGWHVINPIQIPLALVICGALFVRIFGVYRIVPAETLRWSWRKASRSLLLGLTVGPLIGLALKVGFVQIFTNRFCVFESQCLREASTLGLAFGTVLGVTYGIIRGLSAIASPPSPNPTKVSVNQPKCHFLSNHRFYSAAADSPISWQHPSYFLDRCRTLFWFCFRRWRSLH
ncbi:MAG: NACHT domain-containing protein, partial [Phormidesmis sp. RL_2_1]|nr:NACHT domain-containing protein [Phormidesmis sp. RL_2_1]